jgi:predicted short-subunit dehydrogenase-like oxidoreductase (DUF2520 family)
VDWNEDRAMTPPTTPQVGSVGTRPGRLAVGLVGSGRVGPVLAAALGRAGHRIVAATPGRRASLLPGVETLPADEVAARAGLLLLAVPDEVLPDLVAGLAHAGLPAPGTLVVHTSGRYGLAVLDPARERGALPLALHPVMTFTGAPEDADRLVGVSFGVTTPAQLRPIGEALVVEMGGEPVWVSDDDRVLYHAALAHAANHLVTLVGQAEDLLAGIGIDDPARVLAPLLGAALDNALRRPDSALTGPVVRGEAETVAAHLRALAGSPAAASYRALARARADRAIAGHRLDPRRAGDLLAVLAEPGSGQDGPG